MHLLNTTTLELRYWLHDVPPYVILSHTWGEEEVGFDDIGRLEARLMVGYNKIKRCCEKAKEDGFSWAWIDTCCIDKNSSAELSEAINSMYQWYWQAEICYAYLPDVVHIAGWQVALDMHERVDVSSVAQEGSFSVSRWFSRGWTLQELLASSTVEFYGNDWVFLGTKSSLIDEIVYATGIDTQCILDRDLIERASVGSKLKWASQRRTTRPEDGAYSLLGILNVNMPLLYGEGLRAFKRLQSEIMRQSTDHTIFAWSQHSVAPYEFYKDTRPWEDVLAPPSFTGFLARSPFDFTLPESGKIDYIPPTDYERPVSHDITQIGLRISLVCLPLDDENVVAILDCCWGDNRSRVGIHLQQLSDKRYSRIKDSPLIEVPLEETIKGVLLALLIVPDVEEESAPVMSCKVQFDGIDVQQLEAPISAIQLSFFRHLSEDNSIIAFSDPKELHGRIHYLAASNYLALTFQVGTTPTIIFFGIRFTRPFLVLVSIDSWDILNEYLGALEGKFYGYNASENFCDFVCREIEPKLSVQVRAKKTIQGEIICWRLHVIVATLRKFVASPVEIVRPGSYSYELQ